jgi:hypothetical protein
MILLRPDDGPPFTTCVVVEALSPAVAVAFVLGEPVRMVEKPRCSSSIWWIYEFVRTPSGGIGIWIRNRRSPDGTTGRQMIGPLDLVKLNAMERLAAEAGD